MNIKNLLNSIGKFITKLLPWAKLSTSQGLAIANEIKGIADNPAWDIAVSFTSTKLDDRGLMIFRIFIHALVIDLNLAQDATNALIQASETINGMVLPESKAGTLNTIAAAANVKLAEIEGKVMPIETALSIQQSAYFKPELLD